MIRKLLIWFIQKLICLVPQCQVIVLGDEMMKLIAAGIIWCDDCERQAPENAGGEWKRHKVYGKMQKQFPNVRLKELSFAIEEALRRANI